MQYGCLKLAHFSKKSGHLSSTGSEILTLDSHCSANFRPILDCFIPKFKLEYDDLENIKTNRKYSRFQLTSNQTFEVFWDIRYMQTRTDGFLSPELHQSMLNYVV